MENWSMYLLFDVPEKSSKTTIAFSHSIRSFNSSQIFLILILGPEY